MKINRFQRRSSETTGPIRGISLRRRRNHTDRARWTDYTSSRTSARATIDSAANLPSSAGAPSGLH
uniref:Uncharacterized protein n=1 Tax=Pristionchus pacificus TaxID=54126 RepID=A0A2A6BXJ9_PRIPA|eukprot:PDM70732.1 hypothetical protein PRIPAC_44936 [Pristionchus pacificus]